MLNLLFGWRGRIGRGSWWLAEFIAVPIVYLVGFAALAGTASVDGGASSAWAGGAGFLVIAAALVIGIWINVVATIKRFHDRGKSGAWFLIVFVPFIGGIWQLVECGFCSGDDGENQYGPPPGGTSGNEPSTAAHAVSNGNLAKLDDDYFRNYAAAQAKRAAEPAVQSTYARPLPTISPGTTRPAFGKR